MRLFVVQVYGFSDSAYRIAQAVKTQPQENTVIVAAHNGPSGLGSSHHDICGADFKPKAGAASISSNVIGIHHFISTISRRLQSSTGCHVHCL